LKRNWTRFFPHPSFDGQRVIAQGGVLVDVARVSDPRATLDASGGKSYVLKVGKRRFAKITFGLS